MQQTDFEFEKMEDRVSPERIAALRETVGHLSHDARLLVEAVLETPRELVWMLTAHGKPARMTRYALQRYFVGRKGWAASRVWRAAAEVRVALGTL